MSIVKMGSRTWLTINMKSTVGSMTQLITLSLSHAEICQDQRVLTLLETNRPDSRSLTTFGRSKSRSYLSSISCHPQMIQIFRDDRSSLYCYSGARLHCFPLSGRCR
jgi:hypothetical protein